MTAGERLRVAEATRVPTAATSVENALNTTHTRKRMLVLCPYPVGVAAGQRLKFEQYYGDWQRVGWEVVASPYMTPAMWLVVHRNGHRWSKTLGAIKGTARRIADLFRLRRFDLVYCFMYVTPLGSSLMERLTAVLSRRLVYDIEDNVFVRHGAKTDLPHPLLRLFKGSGKAKQGCQSRWSLP